MRRRTFATGLTALALGSLIAGCAGVGVGASPSGPVSPAQDLVGSWRGVFWLLGGSYWVGDGTCLLRIERDGTFTVSVTPTAAANNLAKPGRWSGTAAERGRLVVFSQGRWSSLLRSGDTMYGVASDPTTGADIEIALRRIGGAPGTGGGA
jgi:hypothetical protein